MNRREQPTVPKRLEWLERRDLALTTDFRAVFSEIAGKHLGASKLDAVFPGYTSRGAVGLI